MIKTLSNKIFNNTDLIINKMDKNLNSHKKITILSKKIISKINSIKNLNNKHKIKEISILYNNKMANFPKNNDLKNAQK